jgi:hypothetical protein
MKLKNRFILAALVAAMGLTVNAGWVYTKTGTNDKGVEVGVLSDDNWSFGVTRKNGTNELTVDCSLEGFECRATEPCPIDFTSGITDSEGIKYQVVAYKRGKSSKMTAECLAKISKFIAKDCKSLGGHGDGYDFSGASNLQKVEFNDDLFIAKGGYIFQDCVALKDFSPRTIRFNSEVGYLFKGCKNLGGDFEIYEINEKTSVCNGMFLGTLVGKVTALNATTIGQYAFQDCCNFSNLVTNCKVEYIGRWAFLNCPKIDMEFVTKMLHKELKRLGNEKTGERIGIFSGCTGIEGELVWNLPQIDTNIVPNQCFKDCTNITKVIFKTPIDELRSHALCNLKEGAEIYLPPEVPILFAEASVGNLVITKTQNDPIPPISWPKVYISDNVDEWIEKMGSNNCLLKREDFNKKDWTGTDPLSTYTHNWELVSRVMAADQSMCKKENDLITVYDRHIVGFLYCREKNAKDLVRHYGS